MKRKYNNYFGVNADLTPLKKTYSEDGFLAVLGMLDFTDGVKIKSLFYNDSMMYVYAYGLLSSWERVFPTEYEITSDQLAEKLNWGKRFGFDDDEILYALEKIENVGIIKLNKQLVPYTLIKTSETSSVLPHLYDL